MFCVVFDINWAIVRNEWLFGAFVGVAWHCRALYGVDGRSMALRDAVAKVQMSDSMIDMIFMTEFKVSSKDIPEAYWYLF